MRPRGCARILMVTLAGWLMGSAARAESAATGGTPMIVATSPAVGTNDVDPSVAEITVTFDRDMAKGFSWTGGGPDYPPLAEGLRPLWRDGRTAVLPVKLEPGRYYRVGINSKSHHNFRSAAGVPALPSAIYFTTRGAGVELTDKMRIPAVVSMSPANGAAGVDPQTAELRVTFNVPMGGGFSWTGGGADYPALREGEGPRWLKDGRTCVLPVRLEAGRLYRLGLNSPSHKNFQSASGVPLAPVAYTFKTVGYKEQAPLPDNANFSAAALRMPAKKWPEVSGVVMSLGKADTSKPKLESVARAFAEQAEAEKSGVVERIQEISRRTSSVFAEVFGKPRPVPHAVVTLFRLPEAKEKRLTVTADAEGKFEFFGVGQGLYRIVAQDPRHGTKGGASAEMTVEHYRNRAHVQIVIHPETVTVKGRVTGSQGQPLTNVTVSARQGHERYVPTEGDFTRAYHETTALTDGEGRYELRGLVPAGLWEAGGLEGGGYGGAYAWYTVTIAVPGYASAKAYVPVVPEETRRAARCLAGLLKGVSRILASAHEKAGTREVQPVVQPLCQEHTLTGVDFVLHRATSVKGAFVDRGGLPQAGGMVLLSRTNSVDACSCQAFTESSLWARCDNEGRFSFLDVAPGAYKVQVYEDNRLVSGKPPTVVTVNEGEPVTGLRLVNDALPCGKIVGVVSDAANGKPVKGMTVYSAHKETGSTECPPFLCQCGMRGYHTEACKRWIERAILTNDLRVSTFVVEKAAPGPTELVLKAPDYAEERVTVDVAPEGVVRPKIRLWRAGTALIRPVIESGARVGYYASVQGNPPLVHYVALPETGGPCVRGGSPSRQQAGCDVFEGLKPGRYTLRGDIRYLGVDVTRYETAPLEISSGQTREVALDFSGPCQLKLKADFPPGTAVSVLLETADTPVGQTPESNLGLKASAYLREPGSVQIPDLKPGAYRLSLFRRDVPEKEGVAEKKEPDEVKTVTLEDGQASQAFSFRF